MREVVLGMAAMTALDEEAVYMRSYAQLVIELMSLQCSDLLEERRELVSVIASCFSQWRVGSWRVECEGR